ncbi:MAG: ISAs1 family transposase, partial [Mangrovibacterium sp.]
MWLLCYINKKVEESISEVWRNSLFHQIFSKVSEPRRTGKGNFRHKLHDILLLVLSAVLCGMDEWEEIADFGQEQQHWLRRYGSFVYGIPSHDTLNRVFSAIDPAQFSACFSQWVNRLRVHCDQEVVAIDGKRICNSHHLTNPAIHMVSAFATQNGLCLGQVATSEKSNEITAIPQLLSLLEVKGCIVTIDAMGCQKSIASKIVKQGADYILAVKGNQPLLEEGIQDTIRFNKPISSDVDVDCGHGRIETRECFAYSNLEMIEGADQWEGLKTIFRIDSQRTIKSTGETSQQTRYYISTLEAQAKQFNSWTRNHWAIENNLHWTLDVVFGEDQSRKRKGYAAQNFNTIRKTVMAIL